MKFYKIQAGDGGFYQVFADSPKQALATLVREFGEENGVPNVKAGARPRLMSALQVFNSAGYNVHYFGLERIGGWGSYTRRKTTRLTQ